MTSGRSSRRSRGSWTASRRVQQLDDTTLRGPPRSPASTQSWRAEISEQEPDQRRRLDVDERSEERRPRQLPPDRRPRTRVTLSWTSSRKARSRRSATRSASSSGRSRATSTGSRSSSSRVAAPTGGWRGEVDGGQKVGERPLTSREAHARAVGSRGTDDRDVVFATLSVAPVPLGVREPHLPLFIAFAAVMARCPRPEPAILGRCPWPAIFNPYSIGRALGIGG